MAKLTLRDIGNKLKEKLQQGATSFAQTLPPVQAYNAGKQTVQSVKNYFNPTSNQGNNFWGSAPVQKYAQSNKAQYIQGLGEGLNQAISPYTKLLGEAAYQVGRKVIDPQFKNQNLPVTKFLTPEQVSLEKGYLGLPKVVNTAVGATSKAQLATLGASNPFNLLATGAISSGLGYGLGRVSGMNKQDASREAGRAAGYSPVYAGINKITGGPSDTIAKTLLGSNSNLIPRILTKGSVTGATNVLENMIFTPMTELRNATKGENTLAFLTGMFGSAAGETTSTIFNNVKSAFKKANPELNAAQVEAGAKAYIRDKFGRFTKQATGVEPVYAGQMTGKKDLVRVSNNQYVSPEFAKYYSKVDKELRINPNFDIRKIDLGMSVKDISKPNQSNFFEKTPDAQAGLYDVPTKNGDYRIQHQISTANSKPASDLSNIDEIVQQHRINNGYLTKYDLTDLKKLKDIQGKPDQEIKIYRASPVNELNEGDWVTTSKTYANDIKRQNGGKVYEYTIKAGDLRYPNDLRELPSLARFSAFKYEPKTQPKNQMFEDFMSGKIKDTVENKPIEAKLSNVARQPLSVPSTKGVESMPSVMKTPELPKVDPFEADMIKYNNKLSNAAKLPKTKKPFIDTSRQSTDVGDIKSNIGENGGVVDSIKRSFADWVNTRKASQVEGILQGRSFADLKEKGMQGIFEFQSGDKTGRYADVKNYFDTKYGQMQEKGIDFNYKEDYLTQIWDNTSEEISRVFGRSLSKTPSFTLESLIKNYQEGINAGLKPKYNNIPDLIQSYESATNKAIADHDFFRTLIKENMITTGSKAPRDWVTIDPDRFPRFSVKTDDGTYRGIYKAPPELAKMLNNYLGGAKFEWLAKAADWTSSVKNRVLSFGIPGTAINAHGFNILARNVMASKNPIEGAITGIKYMLNPISAQRQLDATLAKAPEAVKYGLTLSANEFTNILQEPQGFRSKFGDVWNKLFERGLFDRMLPALKLQKFTEVFEGYKKGGMNEYEAGKAAAKFTNDVFGGINIDELGKSRDFENMLRVTILAPDWLKTNLNLAGKIPQSFTTKILDPKMSAYRKFATTMLGSYITANIVNKLTSGHWMYQNDPGNSFNIEAGYTEDGQKRYIRPFGTAADFVRLPSDVFTALKKGDVSVIGRLVRNRLSIPLGVGIGMMTDTDYAGQPIGWRGTDKYGNEMPLKQRIAGVGGEVLTLAGMPSFMKQGIDYASGKTGGEQALLQAFELPVRYSGGAFNKSSQFIKGLGQREGAKGKELYDLIKSVKGVTLSKNQKELLTQNGLKSLPDIMQQKKINSMNTQVQKIKEDIVSGSLTQEEGAVKIQDIVNQIPEVSTNKKGADNSLVSTASASDELNKPYVFQYTSPSGRISIESVDLSKDIPEPKLTGNKELDKKLISTYKGELTSRATDIRKLYEAGKIDANQAEKLLGELKIKSGSVGGAKKPKKITLKVSNYKAPKITIKKRSSAKIPTIKFKKPKKTRIVRRYTIK